MINVFKIIVVLPFLLISMNSRSQYSFTTVHWEEFNSDIGTWHSVSVLDATDVWSFNAGEYMEINGFGGDSDEDWLISPAIDLDAYEDEYFIFDYNDYFTGNYIELYYSTDYTGTGTVTDLQNATWNRIALNLQDINATSCFSSFHPHPAIDISNITGNSVYFAFKYVSTATEARNYSIDNVRIWADYYGGVSTTANCCDLKNTIYKTISKQTYHTYYTSSNYDIWDAMLVSDTRINDSGTDTIMYCMFTDYPNTTGEEELLPCDERNNGTCSSTIEGECYEREHTWPSSWWGGGSLRGDTMYSDLHHLYPSDKGLNLAKSNYPPGIVETASTTGSNGFKVGTNSTYPCASMSYFEPINEYKGDYARTYFFIATRYHPYVANWQGFTTEGDCALNGDSCTVFEPWLLDVLLTWHENDPVSLKEQERNNAVYAVQGNRNPYIDNPAWIGYIWGNSSGATCESVALPIELGSFEASFINDRVEINWSTYSETNNSHFEIQRRTNNTNWTKVGSVDGAGNSSSPLHYKHYDSVFPHREVLYYRLKQVDFDGAFSFSRISSVKVIDDDNIKVFPNPAKEKVFIRYNGLEASGSIELVDSYGRSVIDEQADISITKNLISIDVSRLESGYYFINFKDGEVKKILVLN